MRSLFSSGLRKVQHCGIIAALVLSLVLAAIGYQLYLSMASFIQTIGAHLPGCTKALTSCN